MENLSPSFEFLIYIRQKMEQGDSVKASLKMYCQKPSDSKFKTQVLSWVREFELANIKTDGLNPYHRALKFIIYRGWLGEPILSSLKQLEEEYFNKSQQDIDSFAQKLSVLGLLPLLLLMFPSLVLLFLGPFLSSLNL